MSIGEWIGSSVGFIVAMLGAMGIGVGLVVYAAMATMRGYVAGEEPKVSPTVASSHREAAPAPVRRAVAEPVAVRLAD
jgi:hypothetical protein